MHVKRQLRIVTDCEKCICKDYCKDTIGVQNNLNALMNGDLLEFFEGANSLDDLKNAMSKVDIGMEVYCENFK